MQKIEILGNLGNDVAIRNGVEGKQFNSFQVAVNTFMGQTQWYSVLMPRREKMEPHLTKGTKVYLRGDLSVSIDTLKDGRQVLNMDIFAKEIELCGTRESAPDVQ